MKIDLVQGDTSCIFKFQRKRKDGSIICTKPQKMWITFKDSVYKEKYLFQKTLGKEIIYSEDDNYYRFQLLPDDTNELNYRSYGFDIAIINEAGEKKTLLNNGVLEILEHYTKKVNEV